MIMVNFDGGCWPNPCGHAACGVFIINEDDVLLEQGFYIGYGEDMSSNVAEYHGLIRALQFLKQKRFTDKKIIVYGDSKLVIMQMIGKWKIKEGLYVEVAIKARRLVEEFSDLSFEWIPREENELCDCLSKIALDRPLDNQSPVFKAIAGYMTNHKK